MKKIFGVYTVALALATAVSSVAFAQQIKKFSVIQLTAGMNVIHAEVAANAAEREQGLMFRESMGTNEGMVFLFGAPAQACMWMKNTLIPLSVAFIDRNGRIANIEEMKPQSLDSHCSKGQVYYALEMNAGWFKSRNIKPGTIIDGLPPAH
ncbi:DUF192 domain-containing protein [Oxalicibacterium solurbis]|uniref:DUF192 domain-containing protein n=1 Tax=Oxalicibacterium solurbis TaxID=69280 RepID=A0A8J3F4V0_9BURK|nr:DUF192 domain-containing protein [Oxalicibacterium solurbis]GGI53419.1 hypothetical protein GCM10011430_05930 [Oxalicibacterium solurbis]